MIKCIVLVLALFVQSSAFCQELDRSILGYEDDKSFWLNIPGGWNQDSDIANRFGTIFFLIPEGHDFNSAPTVIYASLYKDKKLKDAVSLDKKKFSQKDPEIAISEEYKIKTPKGKEIIYLVFKSKILKSQPYEAIAYIEEDGVVFTIALSALTEKVFQEMLPTYKKMLESYDVSELKVTDKMK
mgnify:CR=1 FL=1